MQYEEWLDSTGYPDWRKKELREVYKKMEEDNSFFMNEVDSLHKNADVKIFTKEENYPEYKYPRAIWARVDQFKNISGPFFKTIEKKLFALPYFIKKIPKHERPKYINDFVARVGMIYMCTDYTSYESLFTTDLQDDCEFQLYRYMSSKNNNMKRLCKMLFSVLAGDNVCKNKYFKIAVDAKRMSGEMNTSLGNGFSNLMFFLFAVHEYKIGYTGPVVEGDDGLAGLEKKIPDEYFVKMGLNVKMEIKENVNEASFCGIISDDTELINITEPLQHLTFGLWVSSKYAFTNDKTFFGLIKSKALSFAYEYPGCPILSVYAHRILELLKDVEFAFDIHDRWKLQTALEAKRAMESNNFPRRETGPCTRALMERYYGISVQEQLTIERKISVMTFEEWDISDIIPLIPKCWVDNYTNFTRYWEEQTEWSIRRPLLPIGEQENNYKLNKANPGLLQQMSNILTQKQYFKLNRDNFKDLTLKEKQQRYSEYTLRKKDKKERLNKNDNLLKKKKTKNTRPIKTRTILSDCLLLYAKASIDPFATLEDAPCIPDAICAPSYKFNVTLMATMTVGTAGVGYAMLQPITAVVNDNGFSATSIDFPLLVTAATYPYNDVEATVGILTANQIVGINSNSYFSSTVFASAEVRLVAAGIEAFYTGNVLNQAGVVTTLQSDGSQPFSEPTNPSIVMSNPRSSVCANNKDSRCYVSYYPTSSNQFNYDLFTRTRPSVLGLPHTYSMLILVTGAEPGTTFQIKGKCYFEAQIPGLSVTPSESDPLGFAAFNSARTQVKSSDSPQDDFINIIGRTANALANNMSGTGATAGRAIGSLFGQPEIGGLLGGAASTALNAMLK